MWRGLDLTWHPQLRVAVEQVKRWYDSNAGAIVLAGGYGCGKTHIAKEVYRAAGGPILSLPGYLDYGAKRVESVHNSLMYPEPKLFGDIRQTYSDSARQTEAEIIRQCQRCRVLVLDDIGTAHIKDESLSWAQDIYWRLLDTRAQENWPTMLTTNLDLDQLSKRIGARAMDRLIGMMGNQDNYVDMFGIPSYRTKGWR